MLRLHSDGYPVICQSSRLRPLPGQVPITKHTMLRVGPNCGVFHASFLRPPRSGGSPVLTTGKTMSPVNKHQGTGLQGDKTDQTRALLTDVPRGRETPPKQSQCLVFVWSGQWVMTVGAALWWVRGSRSRDLHQGGAHLPSRNALKPGVPLAPGPHPERSRPLSPGLSPRSLEPPSPWGHRVTPGAAVTGGLTLEQDPRPWRDQAGGQGPGAAEQEGGPHPCAPFPFCPGSRRRPVGGRRAARPGSPAAHGARPHGSL